MGQAAPEALQAVKEILNLRDAARFFNSEGEPSHRIDAPPPPQPKSTSKEEQIFAALQRLRKAPRDSDETFE